MKDEFKENAMGLHVLHFRGLLQLIIVVVALPLSWLLNSFAQ